MCPTKLDYTRTKAEEWGYCPEDYKEIKKKLVKIETVGDSSNREFKEGQCNIPFISKDEKDEGKDEANAIYKLKYECNEVKDENNNLLYSWCPIKYNTKRTKKNNKNNSKNNVNSDINSNDDKDNNNTDDDSNYLLKASSSSDTIKTGDWYDGSLSLKKLLTKKYHKTYCQPPKETKDAKDKKGKKVNSNSGSNHNSNNNSKIKDEVLTLETFKTYNCSGDITPSKGGYTRPQLFRFGVDVLKIPHTKLRKGNQSDGIIFDKTRLCEIINTKFRMELQKLVGSNLEEQKLNAYEKDIDKCEEGEKKGGYGINELKNIAITYYGLGEDEVKDYKKPELCKVIRKTLNRIRKAKDAETYLETNTSKVETKTNNTMDTMDNNSDLYNMKYPGDIHLCNESPKKGGINYSKLKHIAENNFNIDITNITKKEELCKLIKNKLDLELINKVKDTKMNKKENTIDEDVEEEEDEDEEDDEDDEDDEEEEEITDDE